MDSLDVIYRAFRNYKETSKLDVDFVSFQRSSRTQDKVENENLILNSARCEINEDWILMIESKLPWIEKAIKEERQFIRNDGEVLEIGKIRKLSVQSIQDLAKHSNYITHLPEEDSLSDVTPDKMLMIRKESDFTVYENRVLYACLVYLRDFVGSRLSVIKDAVTRYDGKMTLSKTINIGNREVVISTNLEEIRKNDPNAIKNSSAQDLIRRLDMIYSETLVLLKTDLMREVGKVDLVKRPITKTNVLKMNHNFKNMLALYDYLVEYEGPGYQIFKETKEFNPLTNDMVSDFTEGIMLNSFITYMHIYGLEPELKEKYQEEELRRKKAEEDKLLERLRRIYTRAKLSKQQIEDYLISFEDGYRILERRNDDLVLEMKHLEEVHAKEIADLNEAHEKEKDKMRQMHFEEVNALHESYQQQIDDLNAAHQEEIRRINEAHALEIQNINKARAEEIRDINAAHESQIEQINNAHDNYVSNLNYAHRNEIDSITTESQNRYDELVSNHAQEMSDFEKEREQMCADLKNALQDKFDSLESSKAELCEKLSKLLIVSNSTISELSEFSQRALYERDLARGEYIGLRVQMKMPPLKSDFISRNRFNDLESERNAFNKFFDETWSTIKESIRKQVTNESRNIQNVSTDKVFNVDIYNEFMKPQDLNLKEEFKDSSLSTIYFDEDMDKVEAQDFNKIRDSIKELLVGKYSEEIKMILDKDEAKFFAPQETKKRVRRRNG